MLKMIKVLIRFEQHKRPRNLSTALSGNLKNMPV